ncbi:MAG TPA: (d)CMP kinase [Peptococcaceae bacterium]|nr:(d)CMP kinase [Peptococcaceae bacterium]
MYRPIIAIDGPAGAGKSTVAREVARRLGLTYIDTGAMYRAVALLALRQGVNMDDFSGLAAVARKSNVAFIETPNGYRTYLNGEDVTEAIREPAVSRVVSLVARVPELRRHLVQTQRQMAAKGGIVMEGRDIGTCVLPWADRKFFITASVEERARRRYEELLSRGVQVSLQELISEIEERDRLDRSRAVAPLVAAADALVIDTTGRSVREVVDLVVREVGKR